ncbi:MAG: glycosyl transferase family protein [Chloroflexi bacterium OLB15]|nr:MAG: glycosyl transferase family protein [Chloroflexi bacterium OLB15]
MQAALFLFIASVYLLTYSSRIESGDALRLYDGLSSLIEHGDALLDLAVEQFPPDTFHPDDPLPLPAVATEPAQMIAAAPLFLIAKFAPGLGLVHTVWLFNIIICALTCCLFFSFALALGFSEKAALAASVALGLGTILWVYSATFFREPLMGLLILWVAFCLERWRASVFRAWLWIIFALIGLAGLALTKASALAALPALAIVALPSPQQFRESRAWRALVIVFALLGGVAALYLFLGYFDAIPEFASRYNLVARLRGVDTRFLGYALMSYLISPGGSIWGTSPMLLAGIPGAVMLARQRRWRYIIACLLMLFLFSVGYALINGQYWFGGLSWPPRFLVPIVPFLMILTLPAFQWLFERRFGIPALLTLLLFAYSVWVQIAGVTLAWGQYALALPPESGGFLEWEGGLLNPAYFRWVIIPTLWGQSQTVIAWILFGLSGIFLLLVSFALVSFLWLVALLNGLKPRAVWITGGLALLLAGITLIGLVQLADVDDRYRAYDASLQNMLPVIAGETNSDDVILLSSPSLQPYFLNYDKRTEGGRVIALPLQPGERPSPEQPAQVVSDNPDRLLTSETIRLITNLALTHDRLWLLVDGGPDLWWSTRPVEQFMNTHYHPVQILNTGPITRLIEYDTTSAPDPYAFRGPSHTTNLIFDDRIMLNGFDLPNGATYAPGALLPISLNWSTSAPIDGNVTFALFLRDASGAPIAQSDMQPGGGFVPTSAWGINVPVWDNRALQLPESLPPGEYQLWLKAYTFGSDGLPDDLPVTGENTLDGVIGVLPVTITVE